jgi:hypothetical protein
MTAWPPAGGLPGRRTYDLRTFHRHVDRCHVAMSSADAPALEARAGREFLGGAHPERNLRLAFQDAQVKGVVSVRVHLLRSSMRCG